MVGKLKIALFLIASILIFVYVNKNAQIIIHTGYEYYLKITNAGPKRAFSSAQHTSNKRFGFNSVTKSTPLQELQHTGSLPSWLTGTFLATVPAQFELGDTKAAYAFSGLAMLHGFYFNGTSIKFHNAFLDSIYYRRCKKKGKFDSTMTTQKKSFFSRLANSFSTPEPYDNGNIAIRYINGNPIALTETTLGVVINPATLQTRSSFDLNEKLEGHLTTAQFAYDPATKAWYNYMTHFAQQSTYHIYKITADNKTELISSIPSKMPSYMRSFAMSNDYIVLIEIPFVVNPVDLLFNAGPFLDAVQWKPELGTRFQVINKHTGQQYAPLKSTQPFFIISTINTVQNNNMLVIDAITYENADLITCISMEALRSDDPHEFEQGYITRFTLDLATNQVSHQRLCDAALEFPTINEQYAMKSYSFVYGLTAEWPNQFPGQLVKIHVADGTSKVWQQQHCFASQPVFVANPKGTAEDDGVILSVVFDSIQNQSFLLILDAHNFTELVRAPLPGTIPLGLSGTFIRE